MEQLSSLWSQHPVKEVVIYSGDAVLHSPDITSIKRQLEKMQTPWKIIEVNNSSFKPKEWNRTTTLVILPGARASALEEQLGDRLDQLIEFVEEGGKYLGICGSAYAACRTRQFLEIEKTSKLAFFNGIAKGPLAPSKESPDGCLACTLDITMNDDETTFSAYLMGGGYAEPNLENEGSHEVLARYKDSGKNAIIKCRVKKGTAILSFPHITWDAEDINVNYLNGNHRNAVRGHDWQALTTQLEFSQNARHQSLRKIFFEFISESSA